LQRRESGVEELFKNEHKNYHIITGKEQKDITILLQKI